MSSQAATTATMIANFDSTSQRLDWEELVKRLRNRYDQHGSSSSSLYSMQEMWLVESGVCRCKRMLNEHTEFATHFAGIIRTAYLYRSRILLTDAELFDGVFFLALGPTTVNGILGKSYMGGPSLVISGRRESMEAALEGFTLRVVEPAGQGDGLKLGADYDRRAPADLLTVRPLEYSAFEASVTEEMVLGQPIEFYRKLAADIKNAHDCEEPTAPIIARALVTVLRDAAPASSPLSSCQLDFLGTRWEEWIVAERRGEVLYENQRSDEALLRTRGRTFEESFRTLLDEYSMLFANAYGLGIDASDAHSSSGVSLSARDASERQEFARVLLKIRSTLVRSEALRAIRDSSLPDASALDDSEARRAPRGIAGGEGTAGCTKRALEDWYQFVYQSALADYLCVDLVSVAAPPNSFAQLVESSGARPALALDGSVTATLGEMPHVVFSQLCYESRSAINRWRACTSETAYRTRAIATKDMAYLIGAASEEHSLQDDWKRVLGGTVLAAILALLSALSDNVWFNGNAPIWLIVLVAWLIAVVPNIIEIVTWLMGTRTATKTVIVMSNEKAVSGLLSRRGRA